MVDNIGLNKTLLLFNVFIVC